MPAPPDPVQLARDTLLQRETRGIPTFQFHVMEHRMIDRIAGLPEGSYLRDPEPTYLEMIRRAGVCAFDQYLATNPLTMGDAGYEGTERGATTGAEEIFLDGMRIDSPEATVAHLEKHEFPKLEGQIAAFDEAACAGEILAHERRIQGLLGPAILKCPWNVVRFPKLYYGGYGYANYFMAFGLYPEVLERHFALQADLATKQNAAAARAWAEGGLPLVCRIDHDIADSRGTLARVEALDRIWFPHFARSLVPALRAGIRLVWHCDGNLMAMVPRLIEAGVSGFQGFQYEDGMDYPRICRMKDREGRGLLITAGVSVTRTLPHGTPADVRREMAWLVENGPRAGLFLGCSSSVAPGVRWDNLAALLEGFAHYRARGRG